ncbi:MAG TPA: hypothetical protein VL490_01420, partial [Mucilaginibacter sp.]|nr:hypothetical protein [Mucilaginibacter sp.]
MKQIEIFKTSVNDFTGAAIILNYFSKYFPHFQVNFDLEDCDRILRIECLHGNIRNKEIEQVMM